MNDCRLGVKLIGSFLLDRTIPRSKSGPFSCILSNKQINKNKQIRISEINSIRKKMHQYEVTWFSFLASHPYSYLGLPEGIKDVGTGP